MEPSKLLTALAQCNEAPSYPAYAAVEQAVIDFLNDNPHSQFTTEELACELTDLDKWADVPVVLRAALTRPNVLAYHPKLAACYELAAPRQIGRNAKAQPKRWRKSR